MQRATSVTRLLSAGDLRPITRRPPGRVRRSHRRMRQLHVDIGADLDTDTDVDIGADLDGVPGIDIN